MVHSEFAGKVSFYAWVVQYLKNMIYADVCLPYIGYCLDMPWCKE